MTKSDLIADLAVSNPHLRQAGVELIVAAIFAPTRWLVAAASSCVASALSR